MICNYCANPNAYISVKKGVDICERCWYDDIKWEIKNAKLGI